MAATHLIGKCKKCKHATRVAATDVQDLDSRKKNAAGELLDSRTGLAYNPARPFILNGVQVAARCPDHGVYGLRALHGRTVETIACTAKCRNATGPSCDCSCGGANHGAGHSH